MQALERRQHGEQRGIRHRRRGVPTSTYADHREQHGGARAPRRQTDAGHGGERADHEPRDRRRRGSSGRRRRSRSRRCRAATSRRQRRGCRCTAVRDEAGSRAHPPHEPRQLVEVADRDDGGAGDAGDARLPRRARRGTRSSRCRLRRASRSSGARRSASASRATTMTTLGGGRRLVASRTKSRTRGVQPGAPARGAACRRAARSAWPCAARAPRSPRRRWVPSRMTCAADRGDHRDGEFELVVGGVVLALGRAARG